MKRFVDQLRWLKDTNGLSLTTLARRTNYSKSSWERYLNGRSLPSVEAVRELAELCRANGDQLVALRALAEESWDNGPVSAAPADTAEAATAEADGPAGLPGSGGPGGPGEADEADAPPAAKNAAEEPRATPTSPPRGRRHRTAVLAAAVGGLAVAAVAVAVLLTSSGSTVAEERTPAQPEFVFEPGRSYDCDVRRDGGLLEAGHSNSTDAVLQQISTSWDVVEAQCLLEHRGYEVGVVDGAYGAATERAVKRFQHDSDLVVDGIMGPHTWKELRR
ncbi:peptidoglycan-binding protein [Streptomyces durbertensis]|uniref:peptidoglycan-binding protein n=1 Tax=Streptomyces durbertensis TaxID=2448886 RepID=UPI002B215551|nr:peptidoglycan-binding protein [Streptomyces durbertensis]